MTFPELFQAIEERRELMVSATEKVDVSISSLNDMEHEVDNIPLIGHCFDMVEPDKVATAYFESLDGMVALEDQLWDLLIDAENKCLDELHHCQHKIEKEFLYAVEKQRQVQTKFFEIEDNIHKLELLLEESTLALHESFEDLFTQNLQMADSISKLAADTFSAMGEFALFVGSDLSGDVEESMVSMRDLVTSISRNRLPAEGNRYRQTLEGTFADMNLQLREQGASLEEAADEIFTHMLDFVGDDVMRSIDAMFVKLIREAIDPMADTVRQCESTMQTGASITGAISPWVHVLKNVKEMVSVVQSTVDSG